MRRKIFIILVAAVMVSGFARAGFAMVGMCDMGHGKAEAAEASNDVGNTTCPISGDKIDEKAKAVYEHEGKTYNFCCPSCIDEFKKDPQKYIEKLEAAEKEEVAGHEGHAGHSQ